MNGIAPRAGGATFILLLICALAFGSAWAQSGSKDSPAPPVQPRTTPRPAEDSPGLQAFHQLLPNDYIRVVLSVDQTFSYERTLDANGDISLPILEKVHVEGLTVSGVEQQLQERYREFYVNPSVDVALVAVGHAEVVVVLPLGRSFVRDITNGQTLGDVVGTLTGNDLRYRYAYVIRGGYDLYRRLTRQAQVQLEVPAMPPAEARASITGGLAQVDTGMSMPEELRLEALLARPDIQSFVVDLAKLARSGALEQNVELRAGDIIFLTYAPQQAGAVIGTGPKFVQVIGLDTLPATYGLLPGETLADLLRLAGYEESPNLDLRNVLIERRDAQGELRRVVVNLDPAISDLDLSTVELAHRDTLRIVPYNDQVFVVGSIRMAGAYAFNPTQKVLDYITLAGGAAGDAHLRFVKVIRQVRTVGAETEHPVMFNVDLGLMMKGLPHEGYSILAGDIIYVPPKGYEPSLRDVSSAMSSLFLGINGLGDIFNSSAAATTGGT